MSFIVVQYVVFFVLLVLLASAVGNGIYKVMAGKKVMLTKILAPIEQAVYRLIGVDEEEQMDAKSYALAVVRFSLAGFAGLWMLLMFQGFLPLNPEGKAGMSWDLALNTAASFITNTNWQAYAGEVSLSYLSQMLGLTVQNFLSAAVGLAVLFAVIRGLILKESQAIGNFWKDLTRAVLYILLPLATVLAVLLASQGVIQTFQGAQQATALESGELFSISLGPVASQAAIKVLGTNGGGFFGTNAAYPLENPTALSNVLQLLSILLIPVSLLFTFGKAVKDRLHARALFITMAALFVGLLALVTYSEWSLGPIFEGVQASGNMEGKEVIHGIGGSALWTAATTATSTGATNSSLSSYTALGSLAPLFLMQLGEIVFGGIGSGIYGMLAFVLLTVFIAGLMVGRTPEYLGKKVDPFDMKMASVIILTPSLLSLIGTAVAIMLPMITEWLHTTGAHGFTEALYNYTSLANNNGSSFAGFASDTLFTNLVGAGIMVIARFVPMIAAIYLAGNFAGKKQVAVTEGTLSTSDGLFTAFLLGVILIIGALSYLPALTLGPIADFFVTR
ncbi:potassium-transporting ATPase subunit KdpA [Trichococcus paludicola]|uniref:potassium-transporting ATPase subunit KdpA n=1 Tax=Trichococcus paludicola TaxID=2052942 RepID=UPI000D3571AA|nr:potassium-transporting ATPase subunit KdpA [Trichococcus paludicola]